MTSYKLVDFKTLGDDRGSLIAIEEGYNAPFDIKRVYYIFDTKEGVERGFHAHINLKQMAIVVKGSCTFVLDNGNKKEEIHLTNPNQGLLIEGLIWREMKNLFSVTVGKYPVNGCFQKYGRYWMKVRRSMKIRMHFLK